MYVIGHTVDTIEDTLMIFAKTIDVHIQVSLVFLCNGCRALMGTDDNMIE